MEDCLLDRETRTGISRGVEYGSKCPAGETCPSYQPDTFRSLKWLDFA